MILFAKDKILCYFFYRYSRISFLKTFMKKNRLQKVITFCNQKGGVGKTTIAVNLTAMLADAGYKICLVDADRQQSASAWYLARINRLAEKGIAPNFQSVAKVYDGMEKQGVLNDVVSLKADYDVLLIDTPGKSDVTTLRLMASADLILIPLPPGNFDFWGSETTRDQVEKLVEAGSVEARILLSRLSTSPNQKNTREAIDAQMELNIPVMQTKVYNRTVYESCASGQTVFELRNTPLARLEMRGLFDEICQILKLK